MGYAVKCARPQEVCDAARDNVGLHTNADSAIAGIVLYLLLDASKAIRDTWVKGELISQFGNAGPRQGGEWAAVSREFNHLVHVRKGRVPALLDQRVGVISEEVITVYSAEVQQLLGRVRSESVVAVRNDSYGCLCHVFIIRECQGMTQVACVTS